MSDLVAYVDLGSGSLIVQVVIATVVAAPFFVRSHIQHALDSLRHQTSSATAGLTTGAKDGPNPG